jgi:hypothetical protein
MGAKTNSYKINKKLFNILLCKSVLVAQTLPKFEQWIKNIY